MQKPAGLVIKETKENIYNTIRTSGLHPAVVEMILREIYDNVHSQAAKIADQEAEEYQMALIREQNEQEGAKENQCTPS